MIFRYYPEQINNPHNEALSILVLFSWSHVPSTAPVNSSFQCVSSRLVLDATMPRPGKGGGKSQKGRGKPGQGKQAHRGGGRHEKESYLPGKTAWQHFDPDTYKFLRYTHKYRLDELGRRRRVRGGLPRAAAAKRGAA